MLLFEFFPAVLAVLVVIVGVMLFVMNRRAASDPHGERPRTPSRPSVPADHRLPGSAPRRPSMRA